MKKGGKFEPFNIDKIRKSIMATLNSTDLSEDKKSEIFGKIYKNVMKFLEDHSGPLSTAEIEAKILLELKNYAPQLIEIWRNYRIQKKK